MTKRSKKKMEKYLREPDSINHKCSKCGKVPFNSEKLVLEMMERNGFPGHAYRCNGTWHHSKSVTKNTTRKAKRCELPILHSRDHAIEAMRALATLEWKARNGLPNVKPCRHWSHQDIGYLIWHVVSFEDGVMDRGQVRRILDPSIRGRRTAQQRRKNYRNIHLPIESWENEGGAIYE